MPPSTHSDSEDDPDYVPPPDDHDLDSSDAEDEVDTVPKAAPKKTDAIEQKKQRDALWATFQASVATPAPPSASCPTPPKHVTIEKTYLFAGKRVTDVVQVAEDSEEARKWPRWVPPASDDTPSTAIAPVSDKETPVVAHVPPPAPTPAKRPGPRKPRTALPSIPIASHPKKITTLDKSAMDWRAHVATQSSDVQDQLGANRRSSGGGYLDKVAFLDRVQDRREDALEASKASKRRKI